MKAEKIHDTLKVAVVSSGLGHVFRGIESWSKDLAYALRESGVAVTLFKGGGVKESEIERVMPCIRRGTWLSRTLLRCLPRFVWRFGFDSDVQIEGTTFALMLLGALIKGHYDIIHTKEPPVASVLRLARHWGLIHSNIIIANGTNESVDFLKKFEYVQHLAPYYLQEACEQAGARSSRWFCLPNFLDTDRFRPGIPSGVRAQLGIPDQATVILSVAAIEKGHKRLDYFIDEMAVLLQKRQEDIYVVIAGGETSETAELMRQGKEKLGSKVRFLVNQPHNKMPELYAAANIFVLCSLREMFGTVLLEAMSSGVVVFGHRHPVLEWVIGAGGECLDMSCQGALSLAIEKHLDRSCRVNAGMAAREYVVRRFSRRVVVGQAIQKYKEIVIQGSVN